MRVTVRIDMISTASRMIIDQEWITVADIAPAAPPAAPPQLPAPDYSRLYAPDVDAEADRCFGPRPYRLTLDMRRQIAAELDAER